MDKKIAKELDKERIVCYADGRKIKTTYRAVCKDLGYIPEVRFVKITTRGTISWWGGKPHEIAGLRISATQKGYKVSKALQEIIL